MAAEDFIITRKRKKYKFARFEELPNCYEANQWHEEYATFTHQPITLELGAGTGLFSLELARRHPDRLYIAADVKADRLYTASRVAHQDNLSNILFLRAHADQLPELFNEASVDELWLTFSDPFPKKRHAKHRLTHPRFLSKYGTLLRSGGIMRQKTDNHALFDWSLEQLVSSGWHIAELSYDLHESKLPDDYKVMTTFESRFVAEGLPIYYVSTTPSDTHERPLQT